MPQGKPPPLFGASAGRAPGTLAHPIPGQGQPLDPAARAFFEPRFGHDFSAVRVHADDHAAESAAASGALAYTVAGHISFGARQYQPESASGKRLIAHELTHVIQQDGARSLPGWPLVEPGITRAPSGLVLRKTTKEDEAKKAKAVEHHQRQQKRVADLIDKAAAIAPDPRKPLAGDNLYRNTAELVKNGAVSLIILTPTHYSKPDNPIYFDLQFAYPRIGGDYPADPARPDVAALDGSSLASLGLARPGPEAGGATAPHEPERQTLQTIPPKTEEIGEARPKDPGAEKKKPAPPKWPLSDIKLYTPEVDIPEADLKNTFVHEGQHVADLSQVALQGSQGWKHAFELYKTEFRAFWIQPPHPPNCTGGACLGSASIDRLPEPTDKPENNRLVNQPQNCTACSSTASSKTPGKSPPGTKTRFTNKRQEDIFWHLISHYPNDQFDCFYTCSTQFRDAVNAFDSPQSVNLINSSRILALDLAIQKLDKTMKHEEVAASDFAAAVQQLDAVDWAFLRQKIETAGGRRGGARRPSDPFWESLKAQAPGFVYKAMETWANKETPPAGADIKKELASH